MAVDVMDRKIDGLLAKRPNGDNPSPCPPQMVEAVFLLLECRRAMLIESQRTQWFTVVGAGTGASSFFTMLVFLVGKSNGWW